MVQKYFVGLIVLASLLPGCSSNVLDKVTADKVTSEATLTARYGYLHHQFTIVSSKVTTNAAYDVTVKREGKALGKGFDDGLLAKTAAREFFSTVGPCNGRKAYAIPHKILYAGKGVWGLRLRCG